MMKNRLGGRDRITDLTRESGKEVVIIRYAEDLELDSEVRPRKILNGVVVEYILVGNQRNPVYTWTSENDAHPSSCGSAFLEDAVEAAYVFSDDYVPEIVSQQERIMGKMHGYDVELNPDHRNLPESITDIVKAMMRSELGSPMYGQTPSEGAKPVKEDKADAARTVLRFLGE